MREAIDATELIHKTEEILNVCLLESPAETTRTQKMPMWDKRVDHPLLHCSAKVINGLTTM